MRLRALPVAVFAVLSVACGGGGPVGPVGEPALRAALLSEQDLPAAYSTSPSDPGGDEEFCDARPSVEAVREVEANFQASEVGPFVQNTLETYEEGEAQRSFDEFVRVLQRCTSWTTELEGERITATIEPLEHEQLGDQSVALRAIVDEPVPLVLEAIGFRRGDVIGGVAVFAVGKTVDPQLAPSLAKTSLEKVDKTL